jgi:hypothetical protein
MKQVKECTCGHTIADLHSLEFAIIGSQIELRCNNCNGLIRWWNDLSKNAAHFRRTWSDEERSAMR